MIKPSSTFAKKKSTEPITLESLEEIWQEAEVIPMKFKPTGEIVHMTPEMAQFIQEQMKDRVFRPGKKKYYKKYLKGGE